MQYTALGHSGIKASKTCIGCMGFGKASPDFHRWTTGPEATRGVIKRALGRGVNFIDTASCYSSGTSEEYVGTALHDLGVARDQVVRAGKVRALGASSMYAYQLHNMQVVAEKSGWTKFTSMRCHYNLLYREDEREMTPVCRQYDAAKAQDMPIVTRVAEVAAARGVPMADVALAWHWARGVDAPIVGCSKTSRVDDAVAALDLKLTDEEVAYLEEPYTAHELVGPQVRPGEKPLAGTAAPKLRES